jgi:hypothetical protein
LTGIRPDADRTPPHFYANTQKISTGYFPLEMITDSQTEGVGGPVNPVEQKKAKDILRYPIITISVIIVKGKFFPRARWVLLCQLPSI